MNWLDTLLSLPAICKFLQSKEWSRDFPSQYLALVPGGIAGWRHALGMRIRIRSRIQGLIYSLRAIYSYTARHAQLRDLGVRLEIKSRSGQVLCPVRFLYAPRLRFSDLLRSKISPTTTPSPADV